MANGLVVTSDLETMPRSEHTEYLDFDEFGQLSCETIRKWPTISVVCRTDEDAGAANFLIKPIMEAGFKEPKIGIGKVLYFIRD